MVGPFSLTPLVAASSCSTDPRLVMPDVLDAIAGEPIEVIKDNVYLRDGYCQQFATSDLQVHELIEDRWRVYPTAAGTHSLTIWSAGQSDTSQLNVVNPLDGGAATRSAVFVGDSITVATGHGGFVKYVKDALGAKLTLLGTQSTAGYAHEGQSGRTWDWFVNDPSSPFANIPGWHSTIGASPDFMIFNLGTNDDYSAPLATIDDTIDAQFAHAETLFAALRAELPSTLFLIGTGFPGNARGSAWGSDATRFAFRSKMHRLAERTMADFGGREGTDGIVVVPTHLSIDPVNGYPLSDQVHPDVLIGHPQIARIIRGALVARWA